MVSTQQMIQEAVRSALQEAIYNPSEGADYNTQLQFQKARHEAMERRINDLAEQNKQNRSLAEARRQLVGGKVVDVTFDGHIFRAELDNGSHIAYGVAESTEEA